MEKTEKEMVKKSKSKVVDVPPGVQLDPSDQARDIETRIRILEDILDERTAAAEVLVANERNSRKKLEELNDKYDKYYFIIIFMLNFRMCEVTFAIAADKARQYKALQEEQIQKINSLETLLTEQREEGEMARHEMQEMGRDKDDEISLKNQSINDLRNRLELITSEFSQMISSTITHLQEVMRSGVEQLRVSNRAPGLLGSEDRGGQAKYLQKLQEFSTGKFSNGPAPSSPTLMS